jgi:hypothetical protein
MVSTLLPTHHRATKAFEGRIGEVERHRVFQHSAHPRRVIV